jgi:transcriptional regulator with XRE-family HTH domain
MKRPKSKRLISLGRAVRERRETLGLSQEALAHACQLDRTYIGGVERGERNLGVINLWRIADALDLHPADLLRAEKKP